MIKRKAKQHHFPENTINFFDIFYPKEPPPPIVRPVDIIIPVYNGLEHLDDLFSSILNHTEAPFLLTVVDDCSPDDRVQPILQHWKNIFGDKMVLYKNEQNLGFLPTVNFALGKTTHDVIILNTDVRVPPNWISRLLYPIYTNELVASVTPFSNAATMFSFPIQWIDNQLHTDFIHIDNILSGLAIHHLPMLHFPTGMGFCMAMSRRAIDSIGVFDPVYGKGYCEENDWCMRAYQRGWINTAAPNLFVYHKHGGSFSQQEKTLLCTKNYTILLNRYPKYGALVQKYGNSNAYHSVRFLLLVMYYTAIAQKTAAIFCSKHTRMLDINEYIHSLNWPQNNTCFLLITPLEKKAQYQITCYYKSHRSTIYDDQEDNIKTLLKHLNINMYLITGSGHDIIRSMYRDIPSA